MDIWCPLTFSLSHEVYSYMISIDILTFSLIDILGPLNFKTGYLCQILFSWVEYVLYWAWCGGNWCCEGLGDFWIWGRAVTFTTWHQKWSAVWKILKICNFFKQIPYVWSFRTSVWWCKLFLLLVIDSVICNKYSAGTVLYLFLIIFLVAQ